MTANVILLQVIVQQISQTITLKLVIANAIRNNPIAMINSQPTTQLLATANVTLDQVTVLQINHIITQRLVLAHATFLQQSAHP